MKSLKVASINGRSYQYECLSALIPRIVGNAIANKSGFGRLHLSEPTMQITVDVRKAFALSAWHGDAVSYIINKAALSGLVTIEFTGRQCLFAGLFLIVKSKQHKKGAVSFSAVSSGEITVTEL